MLILLAEFTLPDAIASTLAFVAISLSESEPFLNFKVPLWLQIVTLLPLSELGNDGWLSKTNPVGSINPSTCNLPDIFKFVTGLPALFFEISNVAPLPASYPPFISIIVWTSVVLPLLVIISPESLSTFKVPLPFGAIVISPFAPSVIVIEPVILFPVCKVTSWFPFDWKTPAAEPVPAATSPLIRTVPSVEFVIVSSFSNIIPALLLTVREPSISVLPLEAWTVNLLLALVPSLLISKSPLLNTLNLSLPTAVVWPWSIAAAAAIPIDLEDIAVVHLSPSVSFPELWVPLVEW